MAWHTQPAGVDERGMYERASQEPGRSSRLCGKAGRAEHCTKGPGSTQADELGVESEAGVV